MGVLRAVGRRSKRRMKGHLSSSEFLFFYLSPVGRRSGGVLSLLAGRTLCRVWGSRWRPRDCAELRDGEVDVERC